jgi:formylglycine-generating enzyme required for sulfatase activity/predicted Ser/Thr protein kinase
MTLCIHSPCQHQNPDTEKTCQACGKSLWIHQQFRPIHQIGQGGFGKTFKAIDEGKPSRPHRAIKQLIFANEALRQESIQYFQKEAEHLERLGDDAQIPALIWTGQEDGHYYIVQEYIDGQNLDQELAESGPFSEEKIRQVLEELLPLLQQLQKVQVIHRDIKPDNIIRRRHDRRLILVDFGAVKIATQTALAKTGTNIGSAEFAAPEQVRGRPEFASDLYSLGVTCLYLMTQVSPFELYSDHEGDWAWRDYLPQEKPISSQLGEILDKLVAQALGKRFSNAQEVLDMIHPPKPQVIASSPIDNAINSISHTLNLPNNGGKLELIMVPEGTLTLTWEEETGFWNRKKVQKEHCVIFKSSFLIGKYPITQRQYEAVMGQNPSYFKGHLDCPVECITWHDAITFCQKLSQILKQKIDLPSETQWEWAARGATLSMGYIYAGSHTLDEVGWYNKNSGGRTHPVGQRTPNELGLYDMSGNVWEWCKDHWTDHVNILPQDGTALIQGGNSYCQAMRGGSCLSDPSYSTCNYRNYGSPDSNGYGRGFRIVVGTLY